MADIDDYLKAELDGVHLFIGPFDRYGKSCFIKEHQFAQGMLRGEGLTISKSGTNIVFWMIKLHNGKKVALVEHTSARVDFDEIEGFFKKFFENKALIDPSNFYISRLPQ